MLRRVFRNVNWPTVVLLNRQKSSYMYFHNNNMSLDLSIVFENEKHFVVLIAYRFISVPFPR